MTRVEFLKYVQDRTKPPYYEKKQYSCEDFADYLNDPRRDTGSSQKIIKFFESMELAMFNRVEIKSGDVLTVNVFYYYGVHYWEDIGCMVAFCGWISNCADKIESFYISEQGKFYNQDHKLKAENEEDFFEYLVTVEYDFHPEIPRRTYHILRHFGWYEGRHIDTSEFEQKAQRHGIEFTREQLDFLSEFSGLEFELSIYESCWRFYSLDKILENYVPIAQSDAQRNVRIEDAFGCGDDGNGLIFLSSDGLLALGVNTPLGRTTMECLNHLCNDSHENESWLEELLKQDEAEDLKQSF